jgi:ABC-type phosphate transport system substrate-binding protein
MRIAARTCLALIALSLAADGGVAKESAELSTLVIVSTKRPLTDVSSADLRRIFLGQITRWRDGRRIQLLVRPAGSPEQRLLLSRVIRMSDIDFSQHWLGQVFRGEAASPPRTVDSADAMKQVVRTNADAIGLLLSSDLSIDDQRTIRALTIDRKSVEEEEYPLHFSRQ